MKISLALGPRVPLSRQTAWGCLTTNLALPGFGSLIAGRISGYPQVALMVLGLVVSVFGLVRAFAWYSANASLVQGSPDDPLAVFAEMWLAIRWALLGLGLFVFALMWALLTSLDLLREAKRHETSNVPPRLS